MKKLILMLAIFSVAFASFAQVNIPGTSMTASGGAVDSANTRYLKAKITTTGCLSVTASVIKIANTGTVFAGYAILQGSINDTAYQDLKTWKLIKDSTSAYGRNIYQVDTFTFADNTSLQYKTWEVNGYNGTGHVVPYLRVKLVGTTSKGTNFGNFWLYKCD